MNAIVYWLFVLSVCVIAAFALGRLTAETPLLSRIRESIQESEKRTKEAVDVLVAQVERVTEVNQSLVQLFIGLAQQIRVRKEDPKALETLADELEARATPLAEAVVKSTPAAPSLAGEESEPGGVTVSV